MKKSSQQQWDDLMAEMLPAVRRGMAVLGSRELAIPSRPVRELVRHGGRIPMGRGSSDVVPLGGSAPGPNEIRIVHVGSKSERIHGIVAHQESVLKISEQIGGFALADNPFGTDMLRNEHLPKHPKEWVTKPHPWVEYEDSDAEWSYPIRYGTLRVNHDRLLVIALHSGGIRLDKLNELACAPVIPITGDGMPGLPKEFQ